MTIKFSAAYISASTNRFPLAAAHLPSRSLVAFGSGALVALWDVAQDRGVARTLAGHEGAVTCVCFLENDEILVSADDKGRVRLWREVDSEWTSIVQVDAHKHAISTLCLRERTLVTGSSDGSVKIWELSAADEVTPVQTVDMGGRYPLAVALSSLPQSQAEILAVGCTDRNIHIFTRSGDSFVRSTVLSGHEDWVKSLAFRERSSPDEPLVLASGSQDATIRLWNIEHLGTHALVEAKAQAPAMSSNDLLLDAFEASLGDLQDGEEGGRQISLKRHILTVQAERYSITFDALLIGHEAGVTSLRWQPTSNPTLLSTSTDSSLIIWSPTSVRSGQDRESTAIWMTQQRFGDVGGQRLGGFVGGLWADSGNEVLAWGWSGGWRRWKTTEKDVWTELVAITGHAGPVKSVAWSPDGRYLVSTGSDQTTRIHAPVSGTTGWHELARPQVHGYDMLGAVFLDPLKFASIADEKVVRVFEAPSGFVQLAQELGVANFSEEQRNRPSAASVPPLGLSNKATSEAASSAPIANRVPFEGELAATTLWPEIEKIFGHGYESICLAASTSRQIIATACKASTAEHAAIRLYDTATWQLVGQPLSGHTLSVTRVAFSPDDSLVVSVSRDRTWRMYEKQADGGYAPVAAEKPHARIIWDCAWAAEGDVFATASRDKTVKIWHRHSDKWSAAQVIQLPDAATAVDFAPLAADGSRVLAIGLESGAVMLCTNGKLASGWSVRDSFRWHNGPVTRLSWRPGNRELASCSEEGTLRVVSVEM